MSKQHARATTWTAAFAIATWLCAPVLAQNKGSRVAGPTASSAPWYSGSHALLIGVSDYTNGWDDLPSVPAELDRVEALLGRHGFDVRRISDPDGEELEKGLRDFVDDHGYTSADDRLFVFFSGHGHTEVSQDGTQRGFLVPADAPLPEVDPGGFKRRALSMEDILAEAKKLEAKHALFVFDSCFSGTVLKTRSRKIPLPISARTARPVRQFITAGNAEQAVPAESYFTPALIQGLEGEADLNGDDFVTGAELGFFLHDTLVSYQIDQTPQYDKINDPRFREGDFVFEVKPPPSSAAESFSRGVLASDNRAFAKAVALYQEACRGGDARSCSNLGIMYANGTGVPRNDARAAELSRQGCEGGSAVGCSTLGIMYSRGMGVPQDNARAVELTSEGCNGGNADGCSALGVLYAHGQGVAQDDVRAADLSRQGCEGGSADGCSSLGLMYAHGQGVAQDDVRAADLFRQGCDGGSAIGCGTLGSMYARGLGVPQDSVRAVKLARQGCDGGNAFGCGVLGFLYESGEGVAMDLNRARELYSEACDGGDEAGCIRLGQLAEL